MGDRVWTPEELERMKPAEQDAVFEASLGADTAEMPAEFLERVRSRVQQRIARDKLRSQ